MSVITAARTVCGGAFFLLCLCCWNVELKPTTTGPCIDCIQQGGDTPEHHEVSSPDVDTDDRGQRAPGPADVEALMHQGDDVHHQHPARDGQVDQQTHPDTETTDSASQEKANTAEEQSSSGEDHADVMVKKPDTRQQFQSGSVEELVHGDSHVHDLSSQPSEKRNVHIENVGPAPMFGTTDVEHVMHGNLQNPHAHRNQGQSDSANKGTYEAGNLEMMIHGKAEGHIHDPNTKESQGKGSKPYKVGDTDVLRVAFLNVHDPASHHEVPSVGGDIDELLGIGKAVEKVQDGTPTVMGTEHLMHGEGGHDHDVKQLKFLKTTDEAEAKDHFDDMHWLLMHSDTANDHKHQDEMIQPGKKVTYKDIMDLGLDEEALKGIGLKKLLMDKARDYDDWQRDKEVIKGESPEASFWEQVRELRQRYSVFQTNDDSLSDSKSDNVDPEQKHWVTGMEVDEKLTTDK